MREIKFRAWHTETQRMFEVDGLSFVHRYVTDEAAQHTYKFHNVALMQYTGLKDCKGQEIYEGDILVHRYPVGRSIYKAVIGKEIHDVDGQSFSYYGTHFAWMRSTDFHRHTNTTGLETDYPQTDYLEIIGNIYQHPELLEGEEE